MCVYLSVQSRRARTNTQKKKKNAGFFWLKEETR